MPPTEQVGDALHDLGNLKLLRDRDPVVLEGLRVAQPQEERRVDDLRVGGDLREIRSEHRQVRVERPRDDHELARCDQNARCYAHPRDADLLVFVHQVEGEVHHLRGLLDGAAGQAALLEGMHDLPVVVGADPHRLFAGHGVLGLGRGVHWARVIL